MSTAARKPEERRRRRRVGLACAAAALALVVAWTAGARAEEPTAPAAPGDLAEKRAADAKAAEFDLYRLPEDYRRRNGALNQAAIAAHQRTRLRTINEKLSMHLRMVETRRYLVFSDAVPSVTNQFVKWCDALYASLCQQFDMDPNDRVWDGKCILILFTKRRNFEQYALIFDGHDARQAGAYFAVENYGPREPNLVHMCFPLDSRATRRLQELFAHEGTHAFFELYKTPGRLPLWLHEGLAEYMTTVNDKALRGAKWPRAARVAASGASVQGLFSLETGRELSLDQYAVAFTMVDFLLAEGRPKFKQFVDALKDGKTQQEALAASYGLRLAELEKGWRTYVTRPIASGR